jgi:hypothetical protein
MLFASFPYLFVLIQSLGDSVTGYPAVYVFIDFNDRSQTAAADATNRFQRKSVVGCRFSIPDIEDLCNFFTNSFSAADMACGTEADGYDISTSRLEAEGAVKGCNTIYLTKGNADLGR